MPDIGTFLGAAGSIIDKFTPNKLEQYSQLLNDLLVAYQNALDSNDDTNASKARKMLSQLRQKMGLPDEN